MTLQLSDCRKWIEVDGRRVPLVFANVEDIALPTRTWHTRQAGVATESGYYLSIVWGDCTYSDNYDRDRSLPVLPFTDEPERVEVMVESPKGYPVPDDVIAYLPTGELATLISDLAAGRNPWTRALP